MQPGRRGRLAGRRVACRAGLAGSPRRGPAGRGRCGRWPRPLGTRPPRRWAPRSVHAAVAAGHRWGGGWRDVRHLDGTTRWRRGRRVLASTVPPSAGVGRGRADQGRGCGRSRRRGGGRRGARCGGGRVDNRGGRRGARRAGLPLPTAWPRRLRSASRAPTPGLARAAAAVATTLVLAGGWGPRVVVAPVSAGGGRGRPRPAWRPTVRPAMYASTAGGWEAATTTVVDPRRRERSGRT